MAHRSPPYLAGSQDLQHTSYLGPVVHHGYYTIFYFIKILKAFDRSELNAELRAYRGPPGFCVPFFMEYVEKGTKDCLPYTDGKLHFTSSQARHWAEHSRVILSSLMDRKVCPRM